MREQKPVIGMRVSLGILAMFEHHKTRGYIVGTSFADFYYRGVSVFSDPVAILCATAQEAPGAARTGRAGRIDARKRARQFGKRK